MIWLTFYVERVRAHNIKIIDNSCFHNHWPTSKTKLKWKHLWEQGVPWCFRDIHSLRILHIGMIEYAYISKEQIYSHIWIIWIMFNQFTYVNRQKKISNVKDFNLFFITDDDCTNHFTPNQVARMHCYIDLVYKTWVHSRKPTPVPLAPVVIGQDADSVTIHWLNPISGPLAHR